MQRTAPQVVATDDQLAYSAPWCYNFATQEVRISRF